MVGLLDKIMPKFEKVDNPVKFQEWRRFAATFDHDTDRPTVPIVMIMNDRNQAIGHYHVLQHPIIFPAFHPSISKREFRDSVEAVSQHFCLSSMSEQYPNGVMFAAIDRSRGFPMDIVDKLGFKTTGYELFRRLP